MKGLSNELMIGNLIYLFKKNEGFTVIECDEDTIKDVVYHNEFEFDNDEYYYKPIPISDFSNLKHDDKLKNVPCNLAHIHELQNWFFWNNQKQVLNFTPPY